MNHLKTFESLSRKLKIGDYIVVDTETNRHHTNITIHTNDIGQVTELLPYCWVNFGAKSIAIDPKTIAYWSESKEELEVKLSEMKYNL